MRGFVRPPVIQPIQLRGYRKPPALGQPLISVNPNVNVPSVNVNPNLSISAPINFDLGNLPLALGLFAGGGVLFFVKNELPKGGWRLAGTIGAGLLALGGVAALILKPPGKPAQAPGGSTGTPPAAPAAAPQTTSQAPAQVAAGTDTSGNPVSTQTVQVPSASDFDGIVGVITQPQDFSNINLWSWQRSYPVTVQCTNPSQNQVTFTLNLVSDESPSPVGQDHQQATTSTQVTLGPGETKNVDLTMPSAAWGFTTASVDVLLYAQKQQTAQSAPVQLDFKSFQIT